MRYLTYVPFPKPLKLLDVLTHQAVERHENIQEEPFLTWAFTQTTHPLISATHHSLLFDASYCFPDPCVAPGLPHWVGNLLRFQRWLNEEALSKG